MRNFFRLAVFLPTIFLAIAQDCEWGEWDACTATCGGGTRKRLAKKRCDVSSEMEPCNTDECYCVDHPGWKSKTLNSCQQYKDYNLCTINATYGTGWKTSWGTFAKYAGTDGLDATQACCCCGRETVLCKGIVCQNGGHCHSGKCFCKEGWTGTYCEKDVCDVAKENMPSNMKSWGSPEGSACGVDDAARVLQEYGCARVGDCNILKCTAPVPPEMFDVLSNCQL